MDSGERSVIGVLNRDHRRIAGLLQKLCAVRDAGERRRLAEEMTGELIRHADAEDLFLYPVVRAIVLDRGADGRLETNAHEQINRLLAELAQIEAGSCRFDVLITKLICAVRNEVRHEEVEVFPWLACCAGEQTLIALGDQVRAFQGTRS
ncbi:hemerythrin domain-containing protein [Actinoallomurus oryzae]|uniref:hemerythrin domain-containing protein n=1 Tax=Actinoallomurus oryzae TaxID=502180 RepID=UPI0031E89FD6